MQRSHNGACGGSTHKIVAPECMNAFMFSLESHTGVAFPTTYCPKLAEALDKGSRPKKPSTDYCRFCLS